MKQIYLLLIALSLTIPLEAQITKTINISAGSLSSVITDDKDSTITSLILTGTIDIRDISTLRDGFPLLTELDLSGTTIITGEYNGIASQANWWLGPSTTRANATFGTFTKPSLTSIQLPSTLEVIGYRGFEGCIGLKSIVIPPTVKYIGESAFQGCTALSSITLPDSVIIYERAFSNCNGLTEIPANLTRIEKLLFAGCTGFVNLNIPNSIKAIDLQAFIGCSSITTLTLPEKLESIESNAFALCPNISSIYSYNPTPPLMHNAFATKVYTDATLYVPSGSKALYAANNGAIDGWNQFTTIVEMDEQNPSIDSLTFVSGGQTIEVPVTIEGPWTASTDQDWLSVSPASGNSGDTLSITAGNNTTLNLRYASVTVSGENDVSQDIRITQHTLTAAEKDTITSLTLTGPIDANDIMSLKDGFPLLTKLDLSGTTITEVQLDGIVSKANWWPGPTITRNPANYRGLIKPSLTSIKLPSTLEVIGYGGFYGCSGLTEITIPPTVTTIGESAFQGCSNLASVIMPPSVTYIGPWAFSGCNALTELFLPSTMTSIGRSVFVECTGFTNLSIPTNIKHIGFEAFRGCSNITTLTLPESMESLDDMAFAFCDHITAIYSYNPVPPMLHGAFDRGIYSNCIVYVPAGSKEAYAVAEEWKDFVHIMETGGIELSANELTIEAGSSEQSITITTTEAWTATSDQNWLTISPESGDTTQTVTLTCLANTAGSRTAIVTFSNSAGNSKTVTLIQHGLVTSTTEINDEVQIQCYPNPFTAEMVITIANPLLKEISVDAFSISGQKIKSLVKAQNGAKLSFTWDGRNENAKQMPAGMYLLKVNAETKMIIKR